jgi:hypothetical protein
MEYISENGILLNDYGHEIRDEDGAIIFIEPQHRKNFEVLTDEQRNIYDIYKFD